MKTASEDKKNQFLNDSAANISTGSEEEKNKFHNRLCEPAWNVQVNIAHKNEI